MHAALSSTRPVSPEEQQAITDLRLFSMVKKVITIIINRVALFNIGQFYHQLIVWSTLSFLIFFEYILMILFSPNNYM
uniref:7TM_GPCR_Srx domain-containing protein n=1 Tax=Heterorhabditis bacteriophora TaxID=37862 RepID=A0A1I7WT26_HETBA